MGEAGIWPRQRSVVLSRWSGLRVGVLLVVGLLLLGACTSEVGSTAAPASTEDPAAAPVEAPADEPDPASGAAGVLEVHFLDVGQGDATLVVGDETVILIDAGRHDRDDVVRAIRSLGVEHLDLVVITHAHADHIGQLDQVLDQFPVDEVWMSGTPHTTATFQRAIAAIEDSSAAYAEPRAGDVASLGDLTIEVLNPVRLVEDHHADGLVVRVVHGGVRFLFTGDSETVTETDLVDRHGGRLAAEIYQVGHHGSRTSSSDSFLGQVQPRVAIYSAAAANSYGHPHPEAIRRLEMVGAEVYGTPTHGRVTVRSNGTSWTVRTMTTVR